MFLTQATKRDLEIAANDLCQGDLHEFHSNIPGRDPRDVLPNHLDETTRVIKLGALVLAVGGSKESIWFVTTNVVGMLTKAQRIRFYRLLKEHLNEVKDRVPFYCHLTNYVSVDNHAHIRLLNSLGATFAREHIMSPAGCRFRQFWL